MGHDRSMCDWTKEQEGSLDGEEVAERAKWAQTVDAALKNLEKKITVLLFVSSARFSIPQPMVLTHVHPQVKVSRA